MSASHKVTNILYKICSSEYRNETKRLMNEREKGFRGTEELQGMAIAAIVLGAFTLVFCYLTCIVYDKYGKVFFVPNKY